MILNEKKFVTDMLQNTTTELSNIHTCLGLYARYLYYEEGLNTEAITKKLDEFMRDRYPMYNPVDWSSRIEKYAAGAEKYPLCQCTGVWITQKELKTIENLQDKVLERLAFTLLCLAKFSNFRNPDNHGWVNCKNGEIYRMACINAPAFEKDMKYYRLRELGLIEYAKKVDNLNVRVLYIDEESPRKLLITDFRRLGYEWRFYKGENYIRCACCQELTKNTNGRRKYCAVCAGEQNRAKTRFRMKIKRSA